MATVRTLQVEIEANSSRFQAQMSAAEAALKKMESPMRTARLGARELSTGMRQLGAESIGLTGPFGRMASGLMELGGATVMYAAAGIGLVVLAAKALKAPFDEADKSLEQLHQRFLAAKGPAAEYDEVLKKFQERERGISQGLAMGAMSGTAVSPAGAGGGFWIGQQVSKFYDWITASSRASEEAKILKEKEEALRQIGEQYNQTLVNRIAHLTMNTRMAAAYEVALKSQGVSLEESIRLQKQAADLASTEAGETTWQKNQRETTEMVKALNLQRETLGMNTLQAKIYAATIDTTLTPAQRNARIAALELTNAAVQNYEAYVQLQKGAEQYNAQLARSQQGISNQVEELAFQAVTFGMSAEDIQAYRIELAAAKLGNDAFTDSIVQQVEVWREVIAAQNEAQRFLDAYKQQEQAASREREQMRKNTLRNMQDSLAQFLTELGTTGNAFDDFCRRILKLWEDLAAQIAAQKILQWILGMGGGFNPSLSGVGDIGWAGAGTGETKTPLGPGGYPVQGMVVHQNISFNISAMDSRSVAQVIAEQKDTIAATILKATQQSKNFRNALARA